MLGITADPHVTDSRELETIVSQQLGYKVTLTSLRRQGEVADATELFIARAGTKRHFVHVSPAKFPPAVSNACLKAKAFAVAVGSPIDRAVLLPIAEGECGQRSLAVFPFVRPFALNGARFRIERLIFAPAVLRWLHKIATLSQTGANRSELAATYTANLDALLGAPGIYPGLAKASARAIEKMNSNKFLPRAVPMHGDLWLGNLLRHARRNRLDFVIIDWGGSLVQGFPVFDLVRLAISLRFSPQRLRRELTRHANALGCSLIDTQVYLLAALGHFARHRGEMPIEAFNDMAWNCYTSHLHAAGLDRDSSA